MRKDISGLRKNRTQRFQIGLIIALGVSILAFTYTSYEKTIYADLGFEHTDEVEIEPPRTDQRKELPPPPPPVLEITEIEPIDEEPIYSDEPLIEEPIDIKPIKIGKPTGKKEELPPPPPMEKEEKNENPDIDVVFAVVEEMPRFPTCEDLAGSTKEKAKCAEKEMLEYIYKRIKYPTLARENNISGMVVVQFVVDKEGNITNPKIVRDPGAGCGAEALRVVKTMPKWIPGRQRNRAVNVTFNLPIRFDLR